MDMLQLAKHLQNRHTPAQAHTSCLTPHRPQRKPHESKPTLHNSRLTPHSKLLTPHTPHYTPLTSKHLTPHSKLLTPQQSKEEPEKAQEDPREAPKNPDPRDAHEAWEGQKKKGRPGRAEEPQVDGNQGPVIPKIPSMGLTMAAALCYFSCYIVFLSCCIDVF